jgi:thioesterase domain-containing protein
MEYCRPLVRHWGVEQTIYGLSTHIAGEDFPSNRVEDLAAHYIQQMQTLYPEGPYFLVGVSHGGIVAFEIAQQLKRRGLPVGFLGILDIQLQDCLTPTVSANRLQTHHQQLLERGSAYVVERSQAYLSGRISQFSTWFRDQSCTAEIRLRRALGQPLNGRLYKFVCKVANKESAQDYTPQTYTGDICLFRALDNQHRIGETIDATLGWRSIVVGNLEVHEVPGSHLGVLQEPNVRHLSDQLQYFINRAEQESLPAANPGSHWHHLSLRWLK